MADQQQLDLLRQGVEAWNAWRGQHPEIFIDLSDADLSGADLYEANLSSADLSYANLSGADLSGADLSDANLTLTATFTGANLSSADLSGANLNGADFNGADLVGADLTRANLTRAFLIGANLYGANLSGTDLHEAGVGQTVFGNVDLRTVKGLESIIHVGPSTIGTDTLLRSEGDIPETFLRKAGLTDTFITYVRSLAQNPIEYYTCIISVRLVSSKHAKAWGWAGKEYSFHN